MSAHPRRAGRTMNPNTPSGAPPQEMTEAEREESARNVAKASGSLLRGLVSLAILVALVVGLLLAVPGLHGVAEQVTHMQTGWLIAAVAMEILSCVCYILAFLQGFERGPVRLGARVGLIELAFGSA